MIKTLVLVLVLTVIGDVLAEAFTVPVPGAAIGMILLAALFAVRGRADPDAASLFDIAAPHFPLFFIPAAVGIVASADILAQAWLHITVAIVLGTAVTITITGAIAQFLLSALGKVRTA